MIWDLSIVQRLWNLRGGVIKNSLLIDGNHNVVASFLTEIKEEDAHLIASAPELLEQLIRLHNKIASYKPDDNDDLDIVGAVIAKALGQQ